MPETFLERIVAATRDELAERRERVPLDELRARAAVAPAPRPFAKALRPAAGGSARLIAEVKRASPSKGLLAETFEPVAQARAYAAGGAAAISVLTEPRYFLGSLDHLAKVRAAVDVPVLRKDFILDSYQVYEARAAGADALLLICAMLDDGQLRELMALTRSLGMEALVEAHNAEEARRAVAVGVKVVGVNARDLRTFDVDTEVVRRLRPLVPADRVFVAESGIGDAVGATRARAWGADAILAGEALMRAPDPTAKARELAGAGGASTDLLFAGSGHPFVKLCSLREPTHGRLATEIGADAFGLIFAPSRRQVSIETAAAIVREARSVSYPPSAFPSSFTAGIHCPLAVGIFVDTVPARIGAVAERVELDAVQLSGNETPEQCAAIAQVVGLRVIKAVRLASADDLPLLDAYAMAGATLLLEPAGQAGYGGNGQRGDWELARAAARRWPVILAGGLTPENVGAAIAAVGPRGVDVSSGTETDGAKDPQKIRAFVEAAKTASEDGQVSRPSEADWAAKHP